MKNLLLAAMLAFFVQVKVPAGMSRTYENVQAIDFSVAYFSIKLTLANGKVVYVPALFTVIEEK